MKIKNRKNHGQKGFTIAIAVLISAAILIIFAAVQQYLKVATFHNMSLITEDINFSIADNGANQTMGLLRANSNLESYHTTFFPAEPMGDPDGFFHIHHPTDESQQGEVFDKDGNLIGQYWSKVRYIDNWNFENPVYYVVTTAWSLKSKVRGNAVRLHTFLELNDANKFFAAIKGDCWIPGGANLAAADVYCKNLHFKDYSLATPVTVDNAYFTNDFTPRLSDWPPVGEIVITQSIDGYPAQKNPAPKFPSINEEVLYYQEKYNNDNRLDDECATWGLGGAIVTPSTHFGAGAMPDDKQYVWYCPGEVEIAGEVHGQVIVVSPEKIWITGDIKSKKEDAGTLGFALGKYADYSGADIPANSASTADQLILISPKGIYIKKDWNLQPELDADDDTLTLQVLVVAPTTSILWDSADPPVATKYLNFKGGMILNDQPKFSDIFQGLGTPGETDRTYAFQDTLRWDPPPLRFLAKIVKQLEERGGAIPSAGPLPTPSP